MSEGEGFGGTGEGDTGQPPQQQQHQESGHNQLEDTRAQVDEVVGIMKDNIEKVLERDVNLSELDERADSLHAEASTFKQHSLDLSSRLWWKNIKIMIMIAVIVIILLLLIIVWATS